MEMNSGTTKSAYELKGISFAYANTPVLDVPSLEIPQQSVTALVGANGSGKTTLLHILAFIENAAAGQMTFFGEKSEPESLERSRRRVSLLLQHPYLFHDTVLANVEYGLKIRGISSDESGKKAMKVLEEVGLAGYEEKDATRLSGGEGKRVALARCLAVETDVLLLDEPLAHVDRESARQIEEIIIRLRNEHSKTIVLASHDLFWAQTLADNVLSFHGGNLVPASLANVFRGVVSDDGSCFDTGNISISLTADEVEGTHIAIDPAAIVLSKDALESSMRNTFQGRIVAISEEGGHVRVDVDAGERFHVSITKRSLEIFDLRLGDQVYLSFKSTSATIF